MKVIHNTIVFAENIAIIQEKPTPAIINFKGLDVWCCFVLFFAFVFVVGNTYYMYKELRIVTWIQVCHLWRRVSVVCVTKKWRSVLVPTLMICALLSPNKSSTTIRIPNGCYVYLIIECIHISRLLIATHTWRHERHLAAASISTNTVHDRVGPASPVTKAPTSSSSSSLDATNTNKPQPLGVVNDFNRSLNVITDDLPFVDKQSIGMEWYYVCVCDVYWYYMYIYCQIYRYWYRYIDIT